MAKSKEKKPKKAAEPVAVKKPAFDPVLASLFASSSGPVEAPPKSRYQPRIEKAEDSESEDDEGEADDANGLEEEVESGTDSSSEEDVGEDGEPESSASEVIAPVEEPQPPAKKRKRSGKEEVEDTYMRKLAREEAKEEEERQKKRKLAHSSNGAGSDDSDSSSAESTAREPTTQPNDLDKPYTIPQHESLAQQPSSSAAEVEKATRTIFLSNVPSSCISSKTDSRTLKKHLESHLAQLASHTPPHKLESLRFRSTAFATALPKRAAFAKREILDATTKSTHAYAVYTTATAAREAVKQLNGTVLLGRHLHVDSVAHPTPISHRRCVFVGNLPFVDDESAAPSAADADAAARKKSKTPADVEEGLWTQFSRAGAVESVRVVRDARTRVGKGFAYVQFRDENAVEAALLFDEKKFPPLLPRVLRVTRCRAERKKADRPRARAQESARAVKAGGGYKQKLSQEQKSLAGRAKSVLGKVARAQAQQGGVAAGVFEGHRARETQGKGGLKFGAKTKGKAGAKARSGANGRKSRSAAWKKGGK